MLAGDLKGRQVFDTLDFALCSMRMRMRMRMHLQYTACRQYLLYALRRDALR